MNDSDDRCSKSPNGQHEPDWRSTSTEWDGDTLYVDVNCQYCGRSGCVGTHKTLSENVIW